LIGATVDLGRVGIWSTQLRTGDRGQARDAVAELDELNFGAIWIPESGTKIILDVVAELLGASKSIAVASGILNIWMHEADEVATAVAQLHADHPERFLLGLGVSHASMVESATGRGYLRPRSMMVDFLDALDVAQPPVTKDDRVLAALGPRMLELARERALGAHPFCVPVSHSEIARKVLGPGPLLAPELKVVLIEDPATAREIARHHLDHYLEMPNYVNNLLRLGFDEDDFNDGGSNHLVDALVAWGNTDVVRARILEHQAAGADHVCVNVITPDATQLPRAEWRELSAALAS
jgi:probable F420-dependent oxidoreductase